MSREIVQSRIAELRRRLDLLPDRTFTRIRREQVERLLLDLENELLNNQEMEKQ